MVNPSDTASSTTDLLPLFPAQSILDAGFMVCWAGSLEVNEIHRDLLLVK